jgi:sugar fermentation stimulation protein A
MKFEPLLQQASLLKRYKRFLVDVEQNGKQFTIHCPNTGAMTGCAEPGSVAWYSLSDNSKRKYPGTLEIVENLRGHLVGVNTLRANKLVAEALTKNTIQGFENCSFQQEVKIEDSRLDFLIETAKGKHYLEVKSVTLGPLNKNDPPTGFFPDAKSQRAIKHLHSLSKLVSEGNSATLLYCVQHTGIREVHPATHIHPEYTQKLLEAAKIGVNIRAFSSTIVCTKTLQLIELKKEIPVVLAE